MGEQPSRSAIVSVAFGVAVMGLFLLMIWGVSFVGCEDAAQEDFNTVRCSDEEGQGWRTFQIVLLCAAAVAFLAGAAWSVRERRFAGLGVGAALLLAAFVAVFALNYKEVGPEYGEEASLPPGKYEIRLDEPVTFAVVVRP